MPHAHDAAVPIDEDDVDGKLHEARVNEITRRDHERAAVKAAAAEQATTARRGIERAFDASRQQHAGVHVFELPSSTWLTKQW